MGGISIVSQPVQIDDIPTQKPDTFVKSQNEDSIMFNELKPKQRDSISVIAWRFTRSMATIVIPANFQQQKETPLVEIVSEDENMFPNHEIT